jgi:hypothetical protein
MYAMHAHIRSSMISIIVIISGEASVKPAEKIIKSFVFPPFKTML